MRFENQVSLYDTDAIINKFTTQDTKINVVQGEIDLIVSETEREELAGGTSTMYSQFADVKLDVEGLTASFSSLEGEFDTLSGQYSSLDSRLTTYKATVDGLSVNVSNIQTNLTENYSTTEDVHAYADGVGRNAISTAASDATTKANNAISTAASDATTKANNAISTAASDATTKANNAISTAASDATTKANDALNAANANTANLLKSYSTTLEMNSAINQKADEIALSVSRTYATTTYVDSSAATYRNLILNSAFIMGLEHWNDYNASYPPAVKEVAIIDGVRYLHLRLNSVFTGISQSRSKDGVYLKPGGKYTIQFRAYKSSSGASQVKLTYYLGSLNNRVADTITIGTNPTTYRVVATVRTNLDRYDYFGIGISGDSSTATDIYLSNFIVREGSFSDDIVWAPAPEDGTTDVAALNAWKSEAELKITDSAIVSTVTNSEGFSSAIEQHANSIRLQATKLSWDSYYSSMTENGYLRCQFADVSGTITGSEIKSSTITGNTISGGTISGATINGNTISGGTISGATIKGNTISGGTISGTTISGTNISGGTVSGAVIQGATISGSLVASSDIGNYTSMRSSGISCWTGSGSCDISAGFIEINGSGRVLSSMTGYSLEIGSAYSGGGLHDASVFYVDGSYLSCSGEKNRIVATQDYGTRALVCYEMPSPMFGDIGTGRTDEDGICYIDFNPIWCETVDLDGEYYVFLQEEGEGKLYVTEKTAVGFYVKGTPNLRFSWEAKAYQFDGRGKYLVDASTRQTNSEVIE